MMARAFIGIGANIDAEENIHHALMLLAGQAEIVGLSTFYRTMPIGRPDQPPFINGVGDIHTQLSPREVKYSLLRGIEQQLGRIRVPDKYAPRPIDLDLLLYDDLVVSEDGMQLPDPDIEHRPFLAIPLYELQPMLRLPDSGKYLSSIVAPLSLFGMVPLAKLTEAYRKEFLHES